MSSVEFIQRVWVNCTKHLFALSFTSSSSSRSCHPTWSQANRAGASVLKRGPSISLLATSRDRRDDGRAATEQREGTPALLPSCQGGRARRLQKPRRSRRLNGGPTAAATATTTTITSVGSRSFGFRRLSGRGVRGCKSPGVGGEPRGRYYVSGELSQDSVVSDCAESETLADLPHGPLAIAMDFLPHTAARVALRPPPPPP